MNDIIHFDAFLGNKSRFHIESHGIGVSVAGNIDLYLAQTGALLEFIGILAESDADVAGVLVLIGAGY